MNGGVWIDEEATALRERTVARLFEMVPNYEKWFELKTLDPTVCLGMLCILKLLDREEDLGREIAVCFELIELRLNGRLDRTSGQHVERLPDIWS